MSTWFYCLVLVGLYLCAKRVQLCGLCSGSAVKLSLDLNVFMCPEDDLPTDLLHTPAQSQME